MHPLVDASNGEDVEVVEILFDSIRERCVAGGVSPGMAYRCVGLTPTHVLLRGTDGHDVKVDRFYACFVGVVPADQRGRPN
jgi:hypothetical protein